MGETLIYATDTALLGRVGTTELAAISLTTRRSRSGSCPSWGWWRPCRSWSPAAVRGTTWLVEARSNDTTFYKVTSGRVSVRDFGRRKTITLRRGSSYTAKPPRRRR
ncbi:MAG TPA: hypothetical protein VK304_08390 [Thermoleophilaceae bacterium]|nr:hypothetical protein [Thermoleophilaceae bacterium]